MAYFPNPISAQCIMLLKIAAYRDLLHAISIVFTEYSGLYNDLCCLQQYTLQSSSPLCIAGQLSCILRLECKHIITVTHRPTKFTRAI